MRSKRGKRNYNIGSIIKRLICYVVGLFIITIGVNISKASALGISPVSSVPRALEVKWGISLGMTTIIVYCVLVLLQIIILGKKTKLYNLLGIPLAWAFGFMVNLSSILVAGISPKTYAEKIVWLVVSVATIGIGVFLYLRPHFVPMPAEGLAAAISEKSGMKFGNCKTIVDCSMILIALIIQFIFLGGFKSFSGETVVVREGTIIAAVCVGQVVKLLTKLVGEQTE
ncbi:MAG: DUF6198 family protein, partial [bacterium]|nr:DUF6198 family protein [bacterium]